MPRLAAKSWPASIARPTAKSMAIIVIARNTAA
jgi:hypothetical protein